MKACNIGRKHKISPRLDRKIVRDVSRNPHVSDKEIVNDLETTGLTVFTKTVSRNLHVQTSEDVVPEKHHCSSLDILKQDWHSLRGIWSMIMIIGNPSSGDMK